MCAGAHAVPCHVQRGRSVQHTDALHHLPTCGALTVVHAGHLQAWAAGGSTGAVSGLRAHHSGWPWRRLLLQLHRSRSCIRMSQRACSTALGPALTCVPCACACCSRGSSSSVRLWCRDLGSRTGAAGRCAATRADAWSCACSSRGPSWPLQSTTNCLHTCWHSSDPGATCKRMRAASSAGARPAGPLDVGRVQLKLLHPIGLSLPRAGPLPTAQMQCPGHRRHGSARACPPHRGTQHLHPFLHTHSAPMLN